MNTTRQTTLERVWAMPSADTFDVPPIAGFVQRYLMKSKVSVDPFARNKRWATYTNDLNPNTAATSHMKALDFLRELRANNVKPDLVIFDPPYSLGQVKQCYESFGKEAFSQDDAQTAVKWTEEKDLVRELLTDDGVFLHFGWHSSGMGRKRGFEIERLLLVCHGAAHNDTICLAERRAEQHPELFPGSGILT